MNEVVGGVIPKEYIPAIQKGIAEQMKNGVLAGYPLLGLKAAVFDGSYHDVDSNEMAFKVAASMATKELAKKGGAVLLEPIMKVEVVTPEDYMGDIVGDLNRRRGLILGMDDTPLGQSHQCRSAARRDVWLCHRYAFGDPGSRDLHYGVFEIR